MKIFLQILLFICLSSVSFGQKIEPDSRLLKNFGQEIYEIQEFRNDYYQYLLFELEEGFQLIKKSELDSEDIKRALSASDFSNGNGQLLTKEIVESPGFNFAEYGLNVKTKEATIIKLSKKEYLVLRSKVDIAAEFTNNPLNHK